jgi:hypothetical protein
MKNFVAGCTIVALIIMVLLAFAQEHEGCLGGRSIKTLKPCGSVSSPV